MKDTLLLKKTNLYHHWIKRVAPDSEIYKLYTSNDTAIRRFKEGRNTGIMLAGGPRIIEGHLLPNNEEYKVIQISQIKGKYYVILKRRKTDGQQDISSDKSAENIQ